MTMVTKKDGTTTALNIDRIERVELNPVLLGREPNIFLVGLVGGAHLVAEEPPEVIIDQIVDAAARVIARTFTMLGEGMSGSRRTAGPALGVVPTGGDDE